MLLAVLRLRLRAFRRSAHLGGDAGDLQCASPRAPQSGRHACRVPPRSAANHAKTGVTSARFEAALVYAHRVHQNQRRKGTGIPYIAHILGVTALAMEYGATEDEAIGALL